MTRLDDLTLSDLLTAIGAKTPTPGGGAVAAVVSAIAASLGQMVLRYSQGKKNLLEHDELHRSALAQLEQFGRRALDLAEADAAAYGKLNELWKLDKADPKRIEAWSAAVNAAIDAPHQLLLTCMDMLRIIHSLAGRTNRMLDSDLAIAAVLANAGAHSAAWNVRINLPLIEDALRKASLESELTRILNEADQIRLVVERSCGAS